RDVPDGRWDRDGFTEPNTKVSIFKSGFLQGVQVSDFDATFFNISPVEAVNLDPQQRMLLELSWEALEDAGQNPDWLVGSRTGVFVGIATSDYSQILAQAGLAKLDPWIATGNAPNTAAGRISYTLGLRGPAVAMDTACSSSL